MKNEPTQAKFSPAIDLLSRGLRGMAMAATEHLPAKPLVAAVFIACACAAPCHADLAVGATPLPSPDKLYGKLFIAVQNARIFPDQKTFVDAVPKTDPATIVARYEARKGAPGFSLKAFVDQHFSAPPAPAPVTPPSGQPLREHIDWLWPALTRTTATVPDGSSLLPLPKPYVVPGGRFREGYYWDSYFTMLGLQASGREDLVDDMLDNFAYEIEKFGHVPNGNRTYYLSRSQPPVFALMVELASRVEGTAPYKRYLGALRKEHAYWMRGAQDARPGQARARVVVLRDGSVLNRYWDDEDTPRPESYLQDIETAKLATGRPGAEVWRDLRAAAESGWDFSSRWLADGATLATIRTTSIIPVDLNSLMFQLEESIAQGCAITREFACFSRYSDLAANRAAAIERHLWHEAGGYYADYDWRLARLRDGKSAAALFPLFARLAPPERAARTLRMAKSDLLQAGGLSTTTARTGQQWDAPNGWAPLQWVAMQAGRNYGDDAFARTVGERFLASVQRLYAAEGKLVEKYVVDGSGAGGGGGEYPLQDGFGWSNGVTLKLLEPHDLARAREARSD